MTFTLLLALKIDMHAKTIKHEEFQTFIKGELALHLKLKLSGSSVNDIDVKTSECQPYLFWRGNCQHFSFLEGPVIFMLMKNNLYVDALNNAHY